MAKLLIAACAALFLLSSIVANPLGHKRSATATNSSDSTLKTIKEIIEKLKNVKKNSVNTSLVPKVNIDPKEKILTIEQIACRGVESLRTLTNPDVYIVSLNRSLAFLSKEENCTVNSSERYDLLSFVNELHSIFRKHYVHHN